MDFSPNLKIAIDAVKSGADTALGFYKAEKKLKISMKEDTSIVTEADLKVQEIVKGFVTKHLPGALFIAEEQTKHSAREDKGYWILDPIDGTKEFSKGIDNWAVLLAYAEGGEIVVGVCYFPVVDKLYIAEKGKGAYLNNHRIRVSQTSSQNKAFSAFSPIGYADNEEREKILKIARSFGSMRSTVASTAGSYVAEGKMDFYIATKHNHIWDNAPFVVIVNEAGGMVTDWKGNAINPFVIDSPSVMSNRVLHEQILGVLNS